MAVPQDQGRIAVRERLDFPYAIDGHDAGPGWPGGAETNSPHD
jgi:hypothetical protein